MFLILKNAGNLHKSTNVQYRIHKTIKLLKQFSLGTTIHEKYFTLNFGSLLVSVQTLE